jgi:hypothetical protein
MQFVFKLIIAISSFMLVVSACAPAPTVAPTATLIPPTASPTHTATATPSSTPTPTETPVPVVEPGSAEWWDKTLAENRVYSPGGLGLGEKTAQTLKFNPKASQPDIHDQILASQMRQLMIPENKYILDKLLEVRPDLKGTVWNSIANSFEFRLDVMNVVMKITGGRLFNKLWPSNTVALWDANQPVQFECEQAQQVPTRPEIKKFGNDPVALGVYINSDGGLVYREEFTSEYVVNSYEMSTRPFYFYCSYVTLMMTEWQARDFAAPSTFTDGKPTFINYRFFALDLRDPAGLRNPDQYSETFLISK